MGPLYRDTITRHKKKKPCWMAKDIEGQEKKEITLFIKIISFLVKVPLSFAILQGSFVFFVFFVCVCIVPQGPFSVL